MRSANLGLMTGSLMLATGFFPAPRAAAGSDLAQQAQQVLQAHCFRCHGQEGAAKGGMNFILDRDKLVDRHKVVPSSPGDSPLYARVAKGDMPPQGARERPNPNDLAVLQRWIEAGAPSFHPGQSQRDFISEVDIIYQVLADLKTVEPRQRRFMRYFTFSNLHNAGVAEDKMQLYRQGLSKLVNSLSWHPRITVPRAVDPAKTLLRIDLRDLQWNAQSWNRVLSVYPYVIPQPGKAFKAIAAATGCDLPYVRADWFVATASRPPLYQDLLQMPTTDRDLERQLRVDVPLDIDEERVVRSGFNGSGIAKNNRMLERHDAAHGAYWRSYDFSDNTDRQNIFDHPLGPQPGQNSFEHAGGEIIFNLPNGLQAYMLVDARGRRLDRAPIEIVSDPKRPDRFVETGVSCMSCHFQGLMFKADQVRGHVEKNPGAFSKEDLAIIKALYPPEDKFKALLDEDAERFRKAVEKTGAKAAEPEPVVTLTLRYEGELDLPAAAAEAGLPADDFLKRLGRAQVLARVLGPLNVKGGIVQRQVFQTTFPDMVRELRLSDGAKVVVSSEDSLNPPVADPRPFEGHTGHILCIAFSPDGKRALSGGEDNTARLWDVATGREIRPLEGHTDEVLAVAFSPDGKRALTGSNDRTMRLWDLASGRAIRVFEAHTERISSVAFSGDGQRALSGSWDQTVSLWDVDSGQELRRLGGHTSYITSVVFSPDGKRALSGSYDRTLRLWDLQTGKEVRRFEGHTKEIYSVAFSADGRRALSGGNDNVVRLWDVDSGKELRHFTGHSKAIIRVAFTADGRRALSGSSQYQGTDPAIRLWDVDSGRGLGSLGGKSDTVWSMAFTPDGRRALSSSSDKTLRLWDLPQ